MKVTLYLVLIYSLFINSAFAWKIKLGPIKVCHNCHRGAQINVNKPIKKVIKKAKKVIKKDIKAYIKKNFNRVTNVVESAGSMVIELNKVPFYLTSSKLRRKEGWHIKDTLKKLESEAKKLQKNSIQLTFSTNVFGLTYDLVKANSSDVRKLSNKVEEYNKKVRHEVGKGLKTVGYALEASGEPKNLLRIALVYTASIYGGPLGAALANVLVDKLVYKTNMTEKELLKSMAIGAAAGYAASHVGGVSQFKGLSYMPNASAAITRNLTEDLGNIVLNKEGYSLKAFFSSLATGASNLDSGNTFISNVLDTTINNTSDYLIDESITTDFDSNYEELSDVIAQGLASGLTTELMHNVLDMTVVPLIPESHKRLDSKAFEGISKFFMDVFSEQTAPLVTEVSSMMNELSLEKKEKVLNLLTEIGNQISNQAALEAFGVPYNDLTADQIISDQFKLYLELSIGNARLDLSSNSEIQEISEIFEEENSSQGRNPSAALVSLVMLTLSAYGTYETIDNTKELYKKYKESDAQGKDFNAFVSENKSEFGILTLDVVLAVLPFLKTSKLGSKAVKGILDSARKLGLKAKDQLTDFANFTNRLMKNETGAIGNITDALDEGSRIIKGMEVVPTRTIGQHTLQRMSERGITESMVDKVLQKGTRYWDPKNKTVNYILEEGFASGKTLLVGQNMATGKVTTVIRGQTKKLVRPRHIKIPNK